MILGRDGMLYLVLGLLAVTIAAAVTLIVRNLGLKGKMPVTQYTEMDLDKPEPGAQSAAPDSGWQLCAAQTIGMRKRQEDALCYSNFASREVAAEKGIFAAVADGIGGMSDGQCASTTVARRLLAGFREASPAQGVAQALLGLVSDAHEALAALNRERSARCGSTLICLWIWQDALHFASIGDSRLYLYRDGGLVQLNREHVLGAQLDEQLVQSAAPENPRRRKSLTSYMGKEELHLIDRNIQPIPLYPGDRLLLMSDGVFGALSEAQIIQGLTGNARDSAEQIIRMVDARRRAHQDNATVVVVGR